MARYRAKTFEVEAVQWRPGDMVIAVCTRDDTAWPGAGPHVHTIGGWDRVKAGDWIVTPKDGGSVFVVDPGDFARRFELVTRR